MYDKVSKREDGWASDDVPLFLSYEQHPRKWLWQYPNRSDAFIQKYLLGNSILNIFIETNEHY